MRKEQMRNGEALEQRLLNKGRTGSRSTPGTRGSAQEPQLPQALPAAGALARLRLGRPRPGRRAPFQVPSPSPLPAAAPAHHQEGAGPPRPGGEALAGLGPLGAELLGELAPGRALRGEERRELLIQ